MFLFLERRDNQPIKEPSLIEMTEKAVQILGTNPNGFFLLVEGFAWTHFAYKKA